MINAIILDIEGTVSPISFVKGKLFPYARNTIATFVQSHSDSLEVKSALNEVKSIIQDQGVSQQKLIAQLLQWIDEDRKITPLKTLQGIIWEAAFEQRIFTFPMFEDVFPSLTRWKNSGMRLYSFSSGSVQAQKTLYAHSNHGNVSGLFDGFFDTQIGGKKSDQSYINIAVQANLKAEEMLFLSDSQEEIAAAHKAGCQTALVQRPGETTEITMESEFVIINTFDQLTF